MCEIYSTDFDNKINLTYNAQEMPPQDDRFITNGLQHLKERTPRHNEMNNGKNVNGRSQRDIDRLVSADASTASSHSLEDKIQNRDVDRGWAFVILIATFISYAISGGMSYSTGIYYVAMLNQFGLSHSTTSWISSISFTFYYVGGVVSSRFTERFGCRVGMFVGATLLTFGSLAGAFATSFFQVLIIYGVIMGIGNNFVFMNMIIVLSQYFRKYHALGTSVAMMGCGMGLFGFSLLLEYVVDEYGWQISFVVMAGISAQYYIMGALYFPLENKKTISIIEKIQSKNELSSKQKVTEEIKLICDDSSTVNGGDKDKISSSEQNPVNDNKCSSELNLLTDIRVWMVCISIFILHLATPTYFVIYKDLLIEMELSSISALGLSVIGAGDVVGRLITGLLASIKCLNIIVLYAMTMFIIAIIFFAHIYAKGKIFVFILSALFGMFYGATNVFCAIVPVKIFGRELLPKVFGYITFSIGISCLIGSPLMGAIMDVTASYRLGLLFLSGDCILAGILMMCVYFHGKYIDK